MRKSFIKVVSTVLVCAFVFTQPILAVSAHNQTLGESHEDTATPLGASLYSPTPKAPSTPLQNQVLSLSFEGDTNDSSGEGNDGTIMGSNYEYIEGLDVGEQALQLKGGTYIELGTNANLQPTNLTLSFWINPLSSMGGGEQAITWSKTTYNSEGWYLSSENASMPLSLSIGASAGQPYKVAVETNRDEFFPINEWTHIAVTYNSVDKEIFFYRNGIRQPSVVKYDISGTANGIINGNSTMMKSIGFNGPIYNGAYLQTALDEYYLYNDVANVSQVVDLYEAYGEALDLKAIAESDLDQLTIPTTVTGDITLPLVGQLGSDITWVSDNPAVIDNTGVVVQPSEDTIVTLNAQASFAGGESASRDYPITIYADLAGNKLKDSGMEDVLLFDDYLVNADQKEVDYLLSLSSNKFLFEFYKVAGLTPLTSAGYEGWERSDAVNFRGHTFGHYMSALSQAYASSEDASEKAALLAEIQDAVDGLEECQDAYGATNPSGAGYISAFRESILDQVQGTGSSNENVIVPWYNLHKVMAGLIHIYQNVDDVIIRDKALDIAEQFGEYIYNRISLLSDNTVLLRTEYGGMNDALYDLYNLTGNDNIKAAAECFDEVSFFRDLAQGKDVLSGKHANTQIPKFIGALKRYTVLTENQTYYDNLTTTEQQDLDMYLQAAINFWDITIEHHTYVTGGNSQSEHFREANKLAKYATQQGDSGNAQTCETCNTYNMLKLTKELFKLTKNQKYSDYYENTYINAILSSQNPDTGMTMYFQPMAPGFNKVYNRPYDEFWCCTGTGMESFSKLRDSIYFTDGNTVFVNMFFSSEFEYTAEDVRIIQTANMPNSSKVKFEIEAITPGGTPTITLRLRQPDWLASTPTLTVNGQPASLNIAAGFVHVAVTAGDIVEYTLPMEVVAYDTPDDPNFVAFKYGPVALSAELGSANIDDSAPTGILVRMGVSDADAQTSIVVQDTTTAQWKEDIYENVVRIEDNPEGKVQFQLLNTDSDDLIYTPHYMQHTQRYGLYMFLEEPDSQAVQDRILENKRTLRELEVSVDNLFNFDHNNFEFDKNLKFQNSDVGTWNGKRFRDAQNGGWFSYDFIISPESDSNYLQVTYYSGDTGRSFDIYINDVKFKTVHVNNSAGSNVFYIETDEIPRTYLDNPLYKLNDLNQEMLDENGNKIPIINLRFASTGGFVGGIFGINITNTQNYADTPELSGLQFDQSMLSPAFSPDEKNYTLTVAQNTQSVKMNAVPNVGSGLIYADGILFNDTHARTVDTSSAPQTLVLETYAQDHTNSTTYNINIVYGDISTDVAVQSVSINKINPLPMAVDSSVTLSKTITPSNATNQNVAWSSSDSNVADVDSSGKVTAKSAGSSIITVTTADGSFTDDITVQVTQDIIYPASISLSPVDVDLSVGEKQQISAVISPANATERTITWSSSDSLIAEIDSTGLVTAKSNGIAVITAETSNGVKANALVTVKQDSAKHTLTITAGTGGSILSDVSGSYSAGETITLTAQANNSYNFSHWSTSNGGTIENANSQTTSFIMPANDTTVTASFSIISSSGSGSSGGGGGGSSSGSGYLRSPGNLVDGSPATSSGGATSSSSGGQVSVSNSTIESAVSKAKENGSGTAAIRVKNAKVITVAELKNIASKANMPVKLYTDTMSADGKSVAIRISVDPAKINTDLKLSASINTAVTEKFNHWFSNKLTVLEFQQAEFNAPVEIALKPSISINTNNLVIYSYNKSTNSYSKIDSTNHWTDSSGYIHFTTSVGGSLILSENDLAKR